MSSYQVLALYQFVDLPHYQQQRQPLLDFCLGQGLKGTLLLAQEGINGTVAGSQQAVQCLLHWLTERLGLAELDYKLTSCYQLPFYRMKVKLKQEIVTLGVQGVNPKSNTGSYVKPEHWNALINDPEVTVLDTRNDYEVAIGTFKGALNPHTQNFRQFPDYVKQQLDPQRHKKVAMFCTGGIRCEKASAFMLEQGFEQVYQLQGGVLKYLEQVPEKHSLWQGECFVFDNRVAVGQQLAPGSYEQCYACRYPVSQLDQQSPLYKKGLHCPRCYQQHSPAKQRSLAERQRQVGLAQQRGQCHIGSF
jgi:UPF0176 protein